MAKNSLEEWVYYLNTGEVPNNATAPGMEAVKEQLTIDRMSKAERNAYYKHLDNIVILRNNIDTEREEGRAEGLVEGRAEGLAEGRAKGREEGLEEGRREMVLKMKELGMSTETIAKITGLSVEEI